MTLFKVPYRITVSFDNEQFTYQILDSTEVQAQNEEDAIDKVNVIWDEGDSLFPDDFIQNVLYENDHISLTELDIGTPIDTGLLI